MSFIHFRTKKVVFISLFLVFLFLFNGSYSLASISQEKTAAELKREGIELYHSGDYAQAIEKLKLIEGNKTADKFILAQAYIYISMSHYCLEEKEESTKWLNKAIQTNPEISEGDLLFPPGFDSLYAKAKEAAKPVQPTAPASIAKKPVIQPHVGTGEKKKKSPLLFIVAGVAGAGALAVALMGKKKPNPGTIQVSSTPTGAKVYLDGSDSGKTTNCTLSNVTAGSHAIKLVKDGYADHSESVAVTGGQTATVDATLVANTIAVTLPTASTVWIKGSQVEIKWQVTATTAGFAQTAISGQMGQSALTEQRLLAQHLGASQPRREAGERLSGGRTSAGSVRTKENTTRSGESREVINSDPAFVQSGIQGSAGATSSSGLPSPQTGPNPLRGRPASQLSSATASLDISKVKIDLYNGSTLITPPIVEETSGSAGTYTWTVRTDLTDGSNYKVRVSCSTDSTVFKNSATFRISGPTQPDLIVDSLMHSPLNPTTADTITIRAVVKNIGSGSAAASTLKIGTETYSIPALAAGASSTMSRTVGPLSAQEWSVTATADLNNVVAELNESNNTLTDSWTVTEPSGADLVVSTLTHSPANPTTADRITVTAVVRNSGGADAVASTLSLSAGGSTTTHSIPVLAAGATSTVTRSVGPLTAGTYTFSATADVNGTVAESNESNNVKTDSFAVTGLPDLIVDSLTHSPLNPTTADTITIRAVVKNIGSGSAVASTLKIGTETYSFPALAAGASSSQNRVVGPLSAQEWSVTATADLNNVVAESNESNNTKTDSWTVTAILPDLEISSLTGTISATGGSFNATVLNSGAASAGASVLKMTLRKGTTVIATQNFAVPTLASGVSHSQAYTITMSVPSGTYTLTAYADTNGVVTESNESNNTKVITKSF